MSSLIENFKNILFEKNKSKVVLQDDTCKLTGLDLYHRVVEVLAALTACGLLPGQKIAVKLPNCIEYVFCYLAGLFGGYTVIPINHLLAEPEVEFILNTTKPDLIISDTSIVGMQNTASSDLRLLSFSSSIAIFFSSGTTSTPKGICHTMESMLANAKAFNEHVQLDENTVMLHVMPMGYMAGFLNTILCPLFAGGCVVIGPQFSPQSAITFWNFAKRHHINSMWLTPTMVTLLTKINRDEKISEWCSSALANIFVGTAHLPASVKDAFESTFKVQCLESYGMSELMLVSSNTSRDTIAKSSVGRVLSGIQIKVIDVDGNIAPFGQEGDICVRSKYAFMGYFSNSNHVGSQAESISIDNIWFSTGDHGYIDDEDCLHITGRSKDLIIHGGTNVSPRAIEEVLLGYPLIEDVAVVGKPHPFWGEEIVALYTVKNGLDVHCNDIRKYCINNLNPDSVPSIYKQVNSFPRTSTGKIQKSKLKEAL